MKFLKSYSLHCACWRVKTDTLMGWTKATSASLLCCLFTWLQLVLKKIHTTKQHLIFRRRSLAFVPVKKMWLWESSDDIINKRDSTHALFLIKLYWTTARWRVFVTWLLTFAVVRRLRSHVSHMICSVYHVTNSFVWRCCCCWLLWRLAF